ncbi:acyl-CoA dehydrogenase family protein [Sorangium sp. So ce1036]|uniref:acyl-CoA dehydrogenase family protein n=1 Tax=Sorangium sp. So ce1036 TaxID=3133328 RepID=UPI003F0DAAFE
MTLKLNRLIDDPVRAARAIAPLARALRDETEHQRRLPPAVVDALVAAGLFRMWVPRELGGAEADPRTLVEAVEALSAADGAAGWCLMIAAGTSLSSGYLPSAGAREIYGDPASIVGGRLVASGRATRVDGGYRVSGRWGFNSGIDHATWLIGGCVLWEGDRVLLRPNGAPAMRYMFFPKAACDVIDTWSVGGLRGTGSHDFTVEDALVPDERSFSFDEPCLRAPLYRLPPFALLAPAFSAVALGIARGAIDALVELATHKAPCGSGALLRDRASAQAAVAQAEAQLRSARLFLLDAVDVAWGDTLAGRPLTLEQRALLRLAATHASTSAAHAVDLMYAAGGASSIYTTNPLERAFRDVHTVTQHVLGQSQNYEAAGRVLLGLEAKIVPPL